jgi:methyl-accepting chemotaxis protein
MFGELGTTNLLLGIIAVVSVLEAIVLAGMGIAGFLAVRRVMRVVAEIETRQVAPAMARVHAILDDVQGVTSRVREETERVDQAIHTTIDRLDDTADRVRSIARARASRVLGFICGLRDVVAAVRATRHA